MIKINIWTLRRPARRYAKFKQIKSVPFFAFNCGAFAFVMGIFSFIPISKFPCVAIKHQQWTHTHPYALMYYKIDEEEELNPCPTKTVEH